MRGKKSSREGSKQMVDVNVMAFPTSILQSSDARY